MITREEGWIMSMSACMWHLLLVYQEWLVNQVYQEWPVEWMYRKWPVNRVSGMTLRVNVPEMTSQASVKDDQPSWWTRSDLSKCVLAVTHQACVPGLGMTGQVRKRSWPVRQVYNICTRSDQSSRCIVSDHWPVKQTLKLKRFRSFSGKCFPFFPGVFPALFRNHSGKTPETDRKKSRNILRNLLSFKVWFMIPS